MTWGSELGQNSIGCCKMALFNSSVLLSCIAYGAFVNPVNNVQLPQVGFYFKMRTNENRAASPITTCCSTCNARKHWKKKEKENNFLCIFRYATPGICLISMDELPLTILLPKTDSLKQMSFHSFSWGQEVISLHFLSTPSICCVLYSVAKIIWIDWPLTFCCCSLWCKF